MKTRVKTRVKKRDFDTIKDTDLIGIVWSDGEKGLLIETNLGVQILNSSKVYTKAAVAAPSKAEYLKKRQIKKVFIFDNNRKMLKWFAKK